MLKDYPTLHLEDKVFVDAEGDVIAQKRATKDYDSVATQVSSLIATSSSKRNNTKLKHLNDYNCTVKGIMKKMF